MADIGKPIRRHTVIPFGQSNWGAIAQRAFAANQLAAIQTYRPPKPIEHAGIRAGEIRAWRCWEYSSDGFLRSVCTGNVWAPSEPDGGRCGARPGGGLAFMRGTALVPP